MIKLREARQKQWIKERGKQGEPSASIQNGFDEIKETPECARLSKLER
jgi:hypothetical protein